RRLAQCQTSLCTLIVDSSCARMIGALLSFGAATRSSTSWITIGNLFANPRICSCVGPIKSRSHKFRNCRKQSKVPIFVNSECNRQQINVPPQLSQLVALKGKIREWCRKVASGEHSGKE